MATSSGTLSTDPIRQEFGFRLSDSMKRHGHICVGIDPHRKNLWDWGYSVDPQGAELFAMRMLQAAEGRAAAVKFMMPMFERYGSKGIAALERALYAAHQMGLITIVDCMRGGLSTTLSSIADAYLKSGGPLYTDAITLIPYYGFHSLNGLIEDALNRGHGVFIASLTSNPEASNLQTAIRQRGEYKGHTVAYGVAQGAQNYNKGFSGMGSVGLVIGATVGRQMDINGIDPSAFTGPILSPGYGWQGARGKDLEVVFAGTHHNVLVTAARAIAAYGPDISSLKKKIDEYKADIQRSFDDMDARIEKGETVGQIVQDLSDDSSTAVEAPNSAAASNPTDNNTDSNTDSSNTSAHGGK